MRSFREVFDHPHGGKGAGERLLAITQGRRTAAEYALEFRTLAAQTNWITDTLKTLFRKGLNHDLQAELACRDDGEDFNDFIELTIRIDNLIRARRPLHRSSIRPVPSTSVKDEPVQVNRYRLTPEERNHRIIQRLCLYCGQPGHMRSSCPSRPVSKEQQSVSHTANTFSSEMCFTVPVTLNVNDHVFTTTTLVDSGAAGNFVLLGFTQQNGISLIKYISPLTVETIDGKPLGSDGVSAITQELVLNRGLLHSETIQFYVLPTANTSIILGLP